MASKQAFWRGKWESQQSCYYSLWDTATRKEIPELRGYSCWDNAKAEAASAPIAAAIEREAKALGYEIVENSID